MDALDVVDWRRRVFALYAEVRAEADPASAHARWRDERDELFAHHPATPLLAEQRDGFTGLNVAPYDARWRFEVPVRPAEPERWEVQTGTDGVVPFDRLGVVTLPGIGDLDVWRLASYGGGVFLPLHDTGCGKPGGGYGGGRYLLDTVKGADLGRRRRPPRRRPQLRLRTVLRLRPCVGLPARASRQPGRRRGAGGRADVDVTCAW